MTTMDSDLTRVKSSAATSQSLSLQIIVGMAVVAIL